VPNSPKHSSEKEMPTTIETRGNTYTLGLIDVSINYGEINFQTEL